MNRKLICLLLMAVLSLTFTLTTKTANAFIIDIDAQVYGSSAAAIYVSLDAGTYSVDPIGIEDGGDYNSWNPWGRTDTNIASDGLQWNVSEIQGWVNKYGVYSENLTAATLEGISVDLSGGLNSYTAWDRKVYATDLDALYYSTMSTFTVSDAGEVGFFVGDIPLMDNSGGMSLSVNLVPFQSNAPTVPNVPNPEPTTMVLLGIGLVGLAGVTVRKKYNKKVVEKKL